MSDFAIEIKNLVKKFDVNGAKGSIHYMFSTKSGSGDEYKTWTSGSSTNPGSENDSFKTRQFYVDITPNDGVTYWAGKRYYGREDIHINDYYIKNYSLLLYPEIESEHSASIKKPMRITVLLLLCSFPLALPLSVRADSPSDASAAEQTRLLPSPTMQKDIYRDGTSHLLNLRVETVPTMYGMDAVMRLFNAGAAEVVCAALSLTACLVFFVACLAFVKQQRKAGK